MERKPISLEKEKFDASPKMDYYPLNYDDWININVEEKNEIIPSYDNSDNFWDEYIKKINRIKTALAFISNNNSYISDNPGYLRVSDDAEDFCRIMIKKISINDRSINAQNDLTDYYHEQTDIISKYIEHKINFNASGIAQQPAIVSTPVKKRKRFKKPAFFQFISPGTFFMILIFFILTSGMLADLFDNYSLLYELFSAISLLSAVILFISAVIYIPYSILKVIFKIFAKAIKIIIDIIQE